MSNSWVKSAAGAIQGRHEPSTDGEEIDDTDDEHQHTDVSEGEHPQRFAEQLPGVLAGEQVRRGAHEGEGSAEHRGEGKRHEELRRRDAVALGEARDERG